MRVFLAFALLIGIGALQSSALAQSTTDVNSQSASRAERQLCGIDPARSTFRADHYRGGDVIVTVPINQDGYPAVPFDAGPLASVVIKTGKVEKSLFPQKFIPDSGEALSAPVTTQVACYADGRRVAVTVPRDKAFRVTEALRKELPKLNAPSQEIPNGTGIRQTSYLRNGVQYSFQFARMSDSTTNKPTGPWMLTQDEIDCPNGNSCWVLD